MSNQDVDLRWLSQTEVLGFVIWKDHNWRGKSKHRIEYEIIGFTTPAPVMGAGFYIDGAGLPSDMDPTERSCARDHKGVLLRRLDDNSKAQPQGFIEWKIRSFLEADTLRAKRFKVRRRTSGDTQTRD